jgi:hypothetical protein
LQGCGSLWLPIAARQTPRSMPSPSSRSRYLRDPLVSRRISIHELLPVRTDAGTGRHATGSERPCCCRLPVHRRRLLARRGKTRAVTGRPPAEGGRAARASPLRAPRPSMASRRSGKRIGDLGLMRSGGGRSVWFGRISLVRG